MYSAGDGVVAWCRTFLFRFNCSSRCENVPMMVFLHFKIPVRLNLKICSTLYRQQPPKPQDISYQHHSKYKGRSFPPRNHELLYNR